MRVLHLVHYAWVPITGFIFACKPDNRQARQGIDTATAPPLSNRSAAVETSDASTALGGPKLIVDSDARAPTLEITTGDYTVRLPPDAAKVLFDSLPGFAPISRASYAAGVKTEVSRNDRDALPLSVTLGDFDGDSVPDIAMIGFARDSVAAVVVLSSGGARAIPKLVFIAHPRSASVSLPQYTYLSPQGPAKISDEFSLRTDGVRLVVFDKTSGLYYFENGQLREFRDSED
jgi:hypothetical protein